MDKNFTQKLHSFKDGEELDILAKTHDYEEGEDITLTVKSENGHKILEEKTDITLTGKVDYKGYAKLIVKTDEYDNKPIKYLKTKENTLSPSHKNKNLIGLSKAKNIQKNSGKSRKRNYRNNMPKSII